MNIVIGADHRGFGLKSFLMTHDIIGTTPITWIDVGAPNRQRSDYPLFARAVACAILKKQAGLGILACGTGAGMTIAANRFRGIYAATVWNPTIARTCREDDNINVISLPADFVSHHEARSIVEAWLAGIFKGDRYAQRLAAVDQEAYTTFFF